MPSLTLFRSCSTDLLHTPASRRFRILFVVGLRRLAGWILRLGWTGRSSRHPRLENATAPGDGQGAGDSCALRRSLVHGHCAAASRSPSTAGLAATGTPERGAPDAGKLGGTAFRCTPVGDLVSALPQGASHAR